MATWDYSETGSGRPLILLHGIGMSRFVWNPVTPHLCSTRRVIAFDIAGFGLTLPLQRGIAPSVPNLVDGLERSIRRIGIEFPIDVAGNSLGGCMALEAAKRGIARNVVAISPIGLWAKHEPRHVQYVFGALRLLATRFPSVLRGMVLCPMLRQVALAVPISTGARHMPVDDAIQAVNDLAKSLVFEETFESTRTPFSGQDIAVPVTVAFGDRDWILPKGSQRRNTLPAHTRWLEMRGWGHVPMWLDPIGVSQLILEATE